MAVGIIVGRAVDVEVAVQDAIVVELWVRVDDVHADVDRVQVRRGDRAEPTGLAGELRALLPHVELSAAGTTGVLGRACGGERCDHDDG